MNKEVWLNIYFFVLGMYIHKTILKMQLKYNTLLFVYCTIFALAIFVGITNG